MQHKRVLISSTAVDLAPYREAVRDVIERFQGHAIRMEVAGARPKDTLQLSLGFARGADITVVLVAHWYGSIVPQDQGGDGERSYTWYEAQAAKQAGKALLVYLLDSKVPWNPEYIEGSTSLPRPTTASGKSTKQMLAEFRAWLKTEAGVTVAEFKDEASLRVQLAADLLHWMNALPAAMQDPGSAEPLLVTWDRPESPYPGLAAYDEDRELLYAGREAALESSMATIRQRLHQPGALLWLQVEGASGAGKSSFALAGLLPRLRALAKSGTLGSLRIARMRPETEPGRNLAKAISHALPDKLLPSLEALAAQLLDKSGNGLVDLLDQHLAPSLPGNQGPPERLVLLIDQFEELFTHDLEAMTTTGPGDTTLSVSTRFGVMLANALSRGNRLLLVTTIRRDYLEELGRLPALDQLLQAAKRINLPRMTREELERAIRLPAEAAGLRWAPPDLPVRLVADTLAQAEGLPLLGLVLERLWRSRTNLGLSEAVYDALGGLEGVLSKQGTALLHFLDDHTPNRPVNRSHVRETLLALVRVEPDGRATRKILTLAALLRATGLPEQHARWLIDLLAGSQVPEWQAGSRPEDAAPPRLIVIGGARPEDPESPDGESATVEIIHESLLRKWKKGDQPDASVADYPDAGLADWIAAERQRLLDRDAFEHLARRWVEQGRSWWDLETGRMLTAYQSCRSPLPDAAKYLFRATRKRTQLRCLLGLLMILLGFGIAYQIRSFQRQAAQERARIARLEQDSSDAEYVRLSEALDDWRGYLSEVQEHSDWFYVGARRLEELAHLLSEDGLKAIDARYRELGVLEVRDSLQDYTLDRLSELRKSAEALRSELERDGVLNWILDDQLRREWVSRWHRVTAGDPGDPRFPWDPDSNAARWYRGIRPRFDFLPHENPARTSEPATLWHFLVLGTGAAPNPTPTGQRWDFRDETGILVAYMAAGEFEMGSPAGEGGEDEHSPSGGTRRTKISPFYIGVTEVTEGQFKALMPPAGDLAYFVGGANYAVGDSSWEEANTASRSLSGRLPTEAEWEYSCRAATRTRWFWGGEAGDVERFANISGEILPVGQLTPNPWGLYDSLGNAWEWCWDWYGSYAEEDALDPRGPLHGDVRVLRGGSASNNADYCRPGLRLRFRSWNGKGGGGFRVAFPCSGFYP